jgi:hypothetical protein
MIESEYIQNLQKTLKVGDKIEFAELKGKYTVKGRSENFVICTQPYNPQKTVRYTIIDFEKDIRGTHNLVFNMWDMKNNDDIEDCLKHLISSEIEISHRNNVVLDIWKVNGK